MITKHLVEQYDGQVWVESRLGEGSKFSFKLKLFNEIALDNIVIEVAQKIDYKFLWKPLNDQNPVKYVLNFDKDEIYNETEDEEIR
jgi:hypothetical protein